MEKIWEKVELSTAVTYHVFYIVQDLVAPCEAGTVSAVCVLTFHFGNSPFPVLGCIWEDGKSGGGGK